jgi:hypothetical protein
MTTFQIRDRNNYAAITANGTAHFDFDAIEKIAALPADQRTPTLRSMAENVFTAAAIGSFIVAKDGLSVLDLIREDPKNFSDARVQLAYAADEARKILEIITSAERRLAEAFDSAEVQRQT